MRISLTLARESKATLFFIQYDLQLFKYYVEIGPGGNNQYQNIENRPH